MASEYAYYNTEVDKVDTWNIRGTTHTHINLAIQHNPKRPKGNHYHTQCLINTWEAEREDDWR